MDAPLALFESPRPLARIDGGSADPLTVAVTGGSGLLGRCLVANLQARGHRVRVVDWAKPPPALLALPHVEWHRVDVRCAAGVSEALRGCSAVLHCASALKFWSAWSWTPREDAEWLRAVNVTGTKHVLAAVRNHCSGSAVVAVVHTSTSSVVFDGSTAERGSNEERPVPSHHLDLYGATKAEAERLVLDANGTEDGAVRTVALRVTGAIYGPGETLHVPRVIEASRGLTGLCAVGGGLWGTVKARADYLAVENAAWSHLLALEAALAGRADVCGEVFNVADGQPENTFVWFAGVIERCGGRQPVVTAPRWLVLWAAMLLELVSWLLSTVLGHTVYPYLTQVEVQKVGMDNYYSVEKARRVLGFENVVDPDEAYKRMADWFGARFGGEVGGDSEYRSSVHAHRREYGLGVKEKDKET